jgi:hypothetical protein
MIGVPATSEEIRRIGGSESPGAAESALGRLKNMVTERLGASGIVLKEEKRWVLAERRGLGSAELDGLNLGGALRKPEAADLQLRLADWTDTEPPSDRKPTE